MKNLLFAAALSAAAPAAQAATLAFDFRQEGFPNAGVVFGSFAGADLDGDGRLNAFEDEVTAFSLSFSGNGLIGPFSLGLADLDGLIYDLGSGFIGGEGVDDQEGIAAWNADFAYAGGPGPVEFCLDGRDCAFVVAEDGPLFSAAPITVTPAVAPVPLPAPLALLAAGLMGLGGLRGLRGRKGGEQLRA